jgi:hypothetical protein
MNRTAAQWLEMIARTRPSAFAVRALKAQLEREGASFTEGELQQLSAALEALQGQIPVEDSSQINHLNIDYRPEGMGGQGRLYLELEGRQSLELIDAPALDQLRVYVFRDAQGFSGVQVDAANTLSERLEAAVQSLDALELPHVTALEAGLEDVPVSSVLEWVAENKG